MGKWNQLDISLEKEATDQEYLLKRENITIIRHDFKFSELYGCKRLQSAVYF
jgi:hypothetical protein